MAVNPENDIIESDLGNPSHIKETFGPFRIRDPRVSFQDLKEAVRRLRNEKDGYSAVERRLELTTRDLIPDFIPAPENWFKRVTLVLGDGEYGVWGTREDRTHQFLFRTFVRGARRGQHFPVYSEFLNIGEPEFCNGPHLYDIRGSRTNAAQSAYIEALRFGRALAEKYWGVFENRVWESPREHHKRLLEWEKEQAQKQRVE